MLLKYDNFIVHDDQVTQNKLHRCVEDLIVTNKVLTVHYTKLLLKHKKHTIVENNYKNQNQNLVILFLLI